MNNECSDEHRHERARIRETINKARVDLQAMIAERMREKKQRLNHSRRAVGKSPRRFTKQDERKIIKEIMREVFPPAKPGSIHYVTDHRSEDCRRYYEIQSNGVLRRMDRH